MTVAIIGSAMITSLGDAEETFTALLAGRSAVAPLPYGDPTKLNVGYAYAIADGPSEGMFRAGRWLTAVVERAVQDAGLDLGRDRIAVVVGTGLRELRSLERWHADGKQMRLADLHFGAAVRAAVPDAVEVHTLANACSASGHALALGMDILSLGEADAVVVAGCDAMTESMLAMIGRVTVTASASVQPFDADRRGVLLGEGAAAVVVRPADGRPSLGTIRGVGLSCDAYHETAPALNGIVAAMRDAHRRAGIRPADIDLVVAHGTSTAMNDPTEAQALLELFGRSGPLITAIKGAVGHTSGGAALMSVQIALAAMRAGVVPPIVGLQTPADEAEGLQLLHGGPKTVDVRLAQVNAFGFGGVNAVTIVEAPDVRL